MTRETDTTLHSMTERMETAQANGHDRYTGLTHQELLQVAIRHRRSLARLQDENERLREGIQQHRKAWKREAAGVPASRFDRELWALAVSKRLAERPSDD